MLKTFPRLIAAARLTAGAALVTVIAGCGNNNYAIVDVPNAVVLADLTGNGYLDVVAPAAQIDQTGLTQRPGYVAVMMNITTSPGSTFGAAANYNSSGVPPSGVAIGDVMGTGGNDIVVANNANGTLSLLTETSPTSGAYNGATTINSGGQPNQIILADMNGDGAPDIVIADGSGYLTILLQNPNSRGSFSNPITFALPAESSIPNQGVSVAVADLNGDGYPDVVITSDQSLDSANGAGTNGYVQVFYGQPGATSTSISFSAPVSLASGIASSCEPSQVRIFDLAASKSVQATLVTAEDTNTMPAAALSATGTDPLSILVACQGLVSSVTGAYTNAGVLVISQTTSTNTGTFNAGAIYANQNSTTYGGGLSLAVGDINGDGLPDVVLTSLYPQGEGTIYVMPQDTTTLGTFDTGTSYFGLGQPVRVQLADINNDGYLDIVLADTNTAAAMLNQTGTAGTAAGTFGTEFQIGY